MSYLDWGFNPNILEGNYGFSTIFEANEAGALDTTSSGMPTAAEIMGMTGALTSIVGADIQYRKQKSAAKDARSALKIKRAQVRINRKFAKTHFQRKMTALLEAHNNLEERSMQQHSQREAAYQQKAGALKVMQAETGAAGISATEAKNDLTRSNLVAEKIAIGNMKKAERSLLIEKEGLFDERLAKDIEFDMSEATLMGGVHVPNWGQVALNIPRYIADGFNTYYDLLDGAGRGGDIV